MPKETIQQINQDIINCTRCPRLIQYIRQVAEDKVRRHQDDDYWGKPVPDMGDTNPELFIIGLAPAAHGANRTGRMWTGDSSGDWLFKALYETGFANQPTSEHREDGLEMINSFTSATCRCAPPANKPTAQEMRNCRPYMERQLALFNRVKVFVPLGRIAFDTICKVLGLQGLDFSHGREHSLPDGRVMICSYHPSKYNQQTGRLKWDDWLSVFKRARQLIG